MRGAIKWNAAVANISSLEKNVEPRVINVLATNRRRNALSVWRGVSGSAGEMCAKIARFVAPVATIRSVTNA